MDFSNIPILRDIDLSDPAKRKNFILIAASGAIFIVLLIVLLARNASGADIQDESALAAQEYESPEIPLGQDKDELEGKNLREVLTGGGKHTADDLFDDSYDVDPLQDILEDHSKDGKQVEVPQIAIEGRTDVYPSRNPETAENTAEATRNPGRPGERESDADRERLSREARVRMKMIENGIDPDTGQPIDSRAAAAAGYTTIQQTPPQVQQVQQPEPERQEEEPVTPKVQVRRSGGVSSLGSGISSAGSGVSSLGEQDQYVTEDPAHPFRVKFAYDEKITAGQRVTLRLCEDMVVDGMLIPVNTHLFATCTIGERLSLKISSISINGKIYTLNYVAFDNDGGEGLYCPSSASAKTKENAIREAGQIVSSAVQSAVSGYTGRMVNSGASIVSSRSGEQKVEVTAGYQFFIMADKR